jgi:acyl-CoA thioesterase-1
MGSVLSVAVSVSLTTASNANEITIAALGDSLTQGYGLPNGQGFVPQLQAWLAQQGEDVTILNAGVSGDTTAGGLRRADWTFQGDVDAVIVALGGNDLLRGLSPQNSRDNIDGILAKARAKGLPVLLIGLDVPGNFGGAYERDFEAIFPDMAAKHNTLLVPNFLGGLLTSEDLLTAFFKYMQPDGLHPNAVGVERIVETIGPSVQLLTAQIKE